MVLFRGWLQRPKQAWYPRGRYSSRKKDGVARFVSIIVVEVINDEDTPVWIMVRGLEFIETVVNRKKRLVIVR